LTKKEGASRPGGRPLLPREEKDQSYPESIEVSRDDGFKHALETITSGQLFKSRVKHVLIIFFTKRPSSHGSGGLILQEGAVLLFLYNMAQGEEETRLKESPWTPFELTCVMSSGRGGNKG